MKFLRFQQLSKRVHCADGRRLLQTADNLESAMGHWGTRLPSTYNNFISVHFGVKLTANYSNNVKSARSAGVDVNN